MADIHIADFHKDAARILVSLYASFPRRVMLCVEDFIGVDTPDEFGLHSHRHMACFSTMVWLAESGFVTYVDTIRQEALDQATLSRAGFLLLANRYPADHLSGVEQLRQALRNGSSQAIETTMLGLLQTVIKS